MTMTSSRDVINMNFFVVKLEVNKNVCTKFD